MPTFFHGLHSQAMKLIRNFQNLAVKQLAYAPVKLNPNAYHTGICAALLGLHHHIGSSLSPQYVGDSRVLSLLPRI